MQGLVIEAHRIDSPALRVTRPLGVANAWRLSTQASIVTCHKLEWCRP